MHVAAEDSRFAHTGGLGEVVAGLSEAQASAGVDVHVLLPGYSSALAKLNALGGVEALGHVEVPFRWGTARFDVVGRDVAGVKMRLLVNDAFFDRPGMYGSQGSGYFDNPVRFAGYARAAATWIGLFGQDPDVVHGHDWHAGLALAQLHKMRTGRRPALVHTVHNLAYQDPFPTAAFELTGLDARYCTVNGVLHEGLVNPLKAGLQLSDWLTTVSPTYAEELVGEAGGSLAGLFEYRREQLSGIVNGVSVAPAPPGEASDRSERREALCDEFGISPPEGPLFAMVSRLTEQKGVDLLVEASPPVLREGAGLVVLGTGDPGLAIELDGLAGRFQDRVGFMETFDVGLATRMFRAADALVMPSRFEPCGMGQMHAMKHRCVPVVRRTGGLADTVRDARHPDGWGFVFGGDDASGLRDAMQRAAATYRDRPRWAQLQDSGEARPVGWERAVPEYDAVYAKALAALSGA